MRPQVGRNCVKDTTEEKAVVFLVFINLFVYLSQIFLVVSRHSF